MAPGYYVIVHTVPTGTDGRNESKAMAATVLAGPETTVELKNDTVTLEKKITNPTDGDAKGGAIDGFTATVSSGVISSDIVNNPGSMLPSTGGMGTVMLYAIGGLIVFAAAVGLTLMLRKRNA